MVERPVHIEKIGGSIPPGSTILESAVLAGMVQGVESSAKSVAKPNLYATESRQSVKKKFEPTVFAKIAKSSFVFFARAIFPHNRALSTNSFIGSIRLEPFCLISSIRSVIFNFSFP